MDVLSFLLESRGHLVLMPQSSAPSLENLAVLHGHGKVLEFVKNQKSSWETRTGTFSPKTV